jgi:NADH dehydrogenase
MFSCHQATLFGGTGFLGRAIVPRLAKKGVIIRVPTRDLEKARALQPSGDAGQIMPFLSFAHSDSDVARAIADSDTVINLIGIIYEKGHKTFQSLHVETAARIARIAKEQGAKNFVHLSFLTADGQSKSKLNRSKAAGEAAVRAFFPEAVILRPSLVFGANDRFFNRFAYLARFSPVIPLVGGATKFQPVYAGDVAEAVMKALGKTNARGQTYELGGPSVYTVRQLMEAVLCETRRSRPFINLPWALAKFLAVFLERMPRPLLSRDMVEMLKTNNVVCPFGALTLRDLGITPQPLEAILPTYLACYRDGGQFSAAN